MPNYLVEVDTIGREVYAVTAADEEEAGANWSRGHLVISETVSVEGVTSVREDT